MTPRSTWIGKGIAVGLAAVALGITLPSESDHTSFPFLARVLVSTLLLSVTFCLYELVGQGLGSIVARFLPDPPIPSELAVDDVPPQPRLRASTAVLILAAYAVGQVMGYVMTALIFKAAGMHVSLMSSDPVPAPLLAAASLTAVLLGGAAAIASTAYVARGMTRASGSRAVGLLPASPKTTLKAALPAAGLALLMIYVGPHLAPMRSKADFGPLVQLANAGGWPRLAWATIAVILAPPIEEFVFRGALLAGLATSWNLASAGAVVTILFVSFHLPYAARYWPAVVGITLMAVYALVLRLRTGSLLPPIAAHLAYNSVVVITLYAARPS